MDAQADEDRSRHGRVKESTDWEILEFRAESFQRLFAPPRREESDSAFQTAWVGRGQATATGNRSGGLSLYNERR